MFLIKRKPLVVSIPKPCNEDWEKMTPSEQGRFCGACQKNVIDFSLLSDDEIIKVIQERKGNVCGRYHISQVNRPLQPTSGIRYLSFAKGFRRIVASALLLFGFLAEARSQQKSPATTHQTPGTYQKPIVPKADPTPIIISGKLLEADSLKPLRNMGLVVKGTTLKAVTDSKGQFQIKLYQWKLDSTVTLIPSVRTQAYCDTLGLIIPITEIKIDTLPFRKELILYRYAAEKFFENATIKDAPNVFVNAERVVKMDVEGWSRQNHIQGAGGGGDWGYGWRVDTKHYIDMYGDLMAEEDLPDLKRLFKKWFGRKPH